MIHAALHKGGNDQGQRSEHRRKQPIEHRHRKNGGDENRHRINVNRLFWGVQTNHAAERSNHNRYDENEQKDVFQKALMRRKRNSIAKAAAFKHALVGDFNQLTALIFDHFRPQRVAIVGVIGQPCEEQHDHQCEHARQFRQRTYQHRHTEQNFTNHHQNRKCQRIRR